MDSIMKKTAFIIGLISLLTACNSGSDDRFMELPDTPAGKASISFDGARTRASLNTMEYERIYYFKIYMVIIR